jgi:flagellar motor switch protein FliM
MAEADTVLGRKLTRGGVGRSPLPDTDVIGETFARAVEDKLRPVVKSSISAMMLESRVAKLGEAVQDISVPAMLGLVDVEDADTQGLLCIDTDLAYHLIDLTLGGDPSVAPMPTTRTFTSIDMALCRFHLDAVIQGFSAAVSSVMGKPIAKRIGLGDQRQNISQVRFAPDYVDVLLYNVALDIGDAARTGNFLMLMPLATLDVVRASIQDSVDDRIRPDDLWRIQMRRAASSAPVRLDAVLHRQPFTLAQLHDLKVGDVIDVPDTAPNDVRVVIGQPGGKSATIATGSLGAYRGAKVLKLNDEVDPRVVQHVKGAI